MCRTLECYPCRFFKEAGREFPVEGSMTLSKKQYFGMLLEPPSYVRPNQTQSYIQSMLLTQGCVEAISAAVP